MCKTKLELINHPINSNRSAGKFKLRIVRIIEDKVVPVEVS